MIEGRALDSGLGLLRPVVGWEVGFKGHAGYAYVLSVFGTG